MSLKHFGVALGILLVLASSLVFYKLGTVPHGMTWDEAAIGYNGYAVITTRRDEWLTRLPLSFRSFGDFKAPLGIYISGIFTTLLGMKLWVVRLPFAMAGVAAVMGMTLFSYQVWKRYLGEAQARPWAVFSGVLLLTTPWFLHHARVGYESVLSWSFFIWGSWVVSLIFSQSPLHTLALKPVVRKLVLTLAAAGLLAGSMYSYHSARLTVPLVTGVLILFWTGRAWRRWWKEIIGLLSSCILILAPFLVDMISGSGSERFKQATIFNKGLSLGQTVGTLFEHVVAYFNPWFLVGGETFTLRHGDGQWGVMLPLAGLLLAAGLGFFLVWFVKGRSVIKFLPNDRVGEVIELGLVWTALGLLPAVMGIEAPHANRALLALPGILLMITAGGWVSYHWIKSLPANQLIKGSHQETMLVLKAAVGTFCLVYLLNFIVYQHHYYTTFAARSASDFMDGYLDAFAYVVPFEKGTADHHEKEKILFTSDYGHPYIYALFVRRTNPIWYQGGSLIKYEFADKITMSDLDRENTVIVASQTDDIPVELADKVIYGSDGQVRFKIYVR